MKMHYTIQELMDKLFHLDAECDEANQEYCMDKENFDIADDNYKIRFAQIVATSEGKTTAEKERAALMSDEWKEYLTAYQALRKAMVQSRVKKEGLQRHWDTCQSLLSAEKAILMKLGGGEQ
jgi:hypothetical protein